MIDNLNITSDMPIEKQPLVINQERFKKLNDDEILVLQSKINDYNWQIDAYTQSIVEAKQNIIVTQESILKVEASNLGINQTIKIIEEQKI